MKEGISNQKICVIGLGYVGLPLACLFAQKHQVVGYDVNSDRVAALANGHDSTGEVTPEELQAAQTRGLHFTCQVEELRDCTVYIVAVPTPVDDNHRPDIRPLKDASVVVGQVISKDNVVIYESTVYPGMTEEECLPVVEQVSGLRLNEDFYAGYSPERINPGDNTHKVGSIVKVTSGSTPAAAQFVDHLYSSVLQCSTYPVSSIRVAEASKIVENTQRDVNIAFMNELAKIFNAMNIDTQEVLQAAATKWNFIPMQPGLVGGHCISVDPYYLIQKAQVYGVMPRIMSQARALNDSMGAYVAGQVVHLMNKKGLVVKNAKVVVLGFAFKENCPDIRNTKVLDIIHALQEYTDNITVVDSWVDKDMVHQRYHLQIEDTLPQGHTYDAAILAVAHEAFRNINIRCYVPQPGVVYDVKSILPKDQVDARL